MTILVYKGEGVSARSLSETVRLFEQGTQKVLQVDAPFLIQAHWEKNARLLVFPGGRDIPYDRALKGEGTGKIRTFVERGGRFLGICAGAYFASDVVCFEPGTPIEVREERELKFFPGPAVGTLYPEAPFCYDSEAGAHPALISFQGTPLHLYYNGGCAFERASRFSTVRILGHFLDCATQGAAIVHCQVGKGAAILSGVHFELSGGAAKKMGAPPQLAKTLEKSEKKRQAILSAILSELL